MAPKSIGHDEVRHLTAEGAQLIEVLPAEEYAWAHLPGALNVPLKELDEGAGRLDVARPIVVYCNDTV